MDAEHSDLKHDASIMHELAIDVTDLHKEFGSKRVLNGVNLQIPQGQIVGLLGLNGAGKSTLIKCLLGLLKPTSGSATVLGRDAWHLDDEQKIKLGYVPQEITLYPWMTVRQMVEYVSAFYKTWDSKWSDELLKRWELPLNDRFGPLSVGQKQKLALVLALGHRPELLILDEATANIDTVTEQLLEEILAKLPAETTRVIIAHRLNTIDNVDQIFFVNSGTVTPAGSMEHAVNMLLHEKRSS